jgi:hypothetical protein
VIAVLEHAVTSFAGRLGHDEEAARAKTRGWTVRSSGRFGLSRVYTDPRWKKAPAAARISAAADEFDEQSAT